jgi:hypothetical protein
MSITSMTILVFSIDENAQPTTRQAGHDARLPPLGWMEHAANPVGMPGYPAFLLNYASWSSLSSQWSGSAFE